MYICLCMYTYIYVVTAVVTVVSTVYKYMYVDMRIPCLRYPYTLLFIKHIRAPIHSKENILTPSHVYKIFSYL